MAEALVPERFVPAQSRGQLVEAEHLVRYWWACRFAEGRRVLDAGCGTAYGTRMLAEAGAAHVTGVDRATAVLEAARPSVPANVELVTGDLRELPFGDRSFDLVVSFEVLEHLDDPDAALSELERVVSPTGIVLASSPNRDVYEPGNPHHLHEYTPAELRDALSRYFVHVDLRRQANLIASALMPDDVAAGDELHPVSDVSLAKCVALPPDGETYTVAMASHAPLPPDRSTTAVATGITEIRRWLELYQGQQAILQEQGARLRRLEDEAVDVRRARETLLEGELAHARAAKLEEDLRAAREETERVCAEVALLHERLEQAAATMAAMQRSPSWRLTAPLRAMKHLLRAR
jgi:SAM-dependent methyltransferase